MNDNRCVWCGRVIPEGRQVCPICEKNAGKRDAVDYWFNEWVFPLVIMGGIIFVILKVARVI